MEYMKGKITMTILVHIVYSILFCFPGLPTHALVRFDVDDCICVVPVKRIVQPSVQQLGKGMKRIVKRSAGKQFTGTVIAVSKKT